VLPDSFIQLIPNLKDTLKCKFVLDLKEYENLPKIDEEVSYR